MKVKSVTVTLDTEHGPIAWKLLNADVEYDVSRSVRPKHNTGKPSDWAAYEYTGIGGVAITASGEWVAP